jgi:hypothetical protein
MYLRFGGICCLHLQSRRKNIEAINTSERLIKCLPDYTASGWNFCRFSQSIEANSGIVLGTPFHSADIQFALEYPQALQVQEGHSAGAARCDVTARYVTSASVGGECSASCPCRLNLGKATARSGSVSRKQREQTRRDVLVGLQAYRATGL